MMNYVKGLILASILLVADTSLLYAQETSDVHPYMTEKFFLDLGVFFPDRELRVRVNGRVVGAPQDIDFEDELKLKKSDETFDIEFGWRFGKKWSLLTQYFESSGATGVVLEEDVEWGDVIFEQGSNVTAGQDFSLIRVFFGRDFATSERHDVGVGLGFHWLEVGAFIEGTAIITGGGTSSTRESVRVAAPLPNIGAWYRYSWSPKWAMRFRYDWFSASVGEYDGTMTNASIGLNYQMFENFGIGMNYNDFELDVGINKSDWNGSLRTSYKGLFVYVSANW
jgi:hypothetical protein